MKKDSLQGQLQNAASSLVRYRLALFFVVLLSVYGYIVWRVGTLKNAEPEQRTVALQTNAALPHIDQATVNKINQLQDNSVSVQALFNQARQNPFQE